nr:hypothetical protein [Mycobacterium sp. 1482292.6]
MNEAIANAAEFAYVDAAQRGTLDVRAAYDANADTLAVTVDDRGVGDRLVHRQQQIAEPVVVKGEVPLEPRREFGAGAGRAARVGDHTRPYEAGSVIDVGHVLRLVSASRHSQLHCHPVDAHSPAMPLSAPSRLL